MARLLMIRIPVNALDVLIAGIALAHGAESISSNDTDFLEMT